MPAVQDFERRLGILKEVEPIIENAVKTLSKAIDLSGSPLEPPKPKVVAKPKEEEEFSLESLSQAAAAPAQSAGGIDLSQLTALLGASQQAPEPEAAPEPSSDGGLDLAALLGGAAAAAPAPSEEEGLSPDMEKQMLSKLLGRL